MVKEGKAVLNTTVDKDLLKDLKIQAVQEGVRVNVLLEEAIRALLAQRKDAQGQG